MVARVLTSRIFHEGLLQDNAGIANRTRPAFTPLSIQLIQASQQIVSTKDIAQTKQDAPMKVAIPLMNPLYKGLIQEAEAFNGSYWHHTDQWLVLLMIIVHTLAIFWMAVYIATSKKLIDPIAKDPLGIARNSWT